MKPFQLRTKGGELQHGGQWLIRFKAPDGNWRRMVAGTSEKEAARVLRGIETDIERGTWVDPRSVRAEARTRDNDCRTFGDIVDRFRVSYADRSTASRRNLESAVTRLSRGFKGEPPLLPMATPIGGLTPARLRRAHEMIAASACAVATKNLLLAYLRMICRWAYRHPAIPLEVNPTEGLPTFKVAGTRGGDGFNNTIAASEVWTVQEAVAMVEHAEAHEAEVFAVMLRTALETGLRCGELRGLLWSGVDFDRRLVRVERTYERRGTKSGRDRVVPLAIGLAERLRRWRLASPCSRESDPVFPGDDGNVRTTPRDWAAQVRRTAEAAGCWHPGMKRAGHLTRHYYATAWLKAGGSAEQLARILGHVDTSLICRVYSHFMPADFVATIDRIGLALEPTAPAEVVQIRR